MKNLLETVKNSPLFHGIAFSDFEKMLGCLSAQTSRYKKDEVILMTGDAISFVGLILSGGVQLTNEDFHGRSTILAEFFATEIFGEVFACAEITHSPITISATEDTEILFINYKCIITPCAAACPFHATLIKNMLKIIAQKNLFLNRKLEILSKRSTREKLLHYFDTQRGADKKFTIAFNREELANFLCVDRSAMSSELGKMRDEGLIKFERNRFEIL